MGLIIAKLLCQPYSGPQLNEATKKPNLTMLTFNCKGLGNIHKLKRALTKCDKLTSQNGIV
jgi:hypothetical protein